MTAYLLTILLLWPLGLGQQQDSTPAWWLGRVVWIAVPGVILAGLVAIFGRFERPRSRVRPAVAGPTASDADPG